MKRKQQPCRAGETADHGGWFGHRSRLRARVWESGMETLQDYEMLELLLTYALPRIDTKPIAKALIHRFGSFSSVLDAPAADVQSIPGVGPRAAALLTSIKEIAVGYLKDRVLRTDVIRNPRAVVDYCRARLAGRKNESVHVLFVDNRNAVMQDRTLFEGSAGEAAAYPRRIAEEALLVGATGVVLVHNHPSGQVSPSPEDRALTRRVAEALRTMDVRLLDHIVVGREGFYSFQEAGELPARK